MHSRVSPSKPAEHRPAPTIASKNRWYVAETLPAREDLAIQNLRRQSFQSFCPRFRKVRRHARRQHTVLAPLFPGYVFVRMDPERHAWRSINGTFGVRALICGDRLRPSALPDAAMHQILSRCEDEVVRHLLVEPIPGQTVQIVSGPFADRLASIETLDGKGRVRVLLDLLGTECSVWTDLSAVAPA
jgi:transcriptional antiterminator RfaH